MTDLRRSANPSVNPLPNPSLNPSRNPGLNNSNATAPCNATTTHLNSTQLNITSRPAGGVKSPRQIRSARVTATGLSAKARVDSGDQPMTIASHATQPQTAPTEEIA